MPITLKAAGELIRRKTRPDITVVEDPFRDLLVISAPGCRGWVEVTRKEIDDNLDVGKVRRFFGIKPDSAGYPPAA